MKTLLIAILVASLTGLASYRMGRSNGFDSGWDKGYIRGLENAECIDQDAGHE